MDREGLRGRRCRLTNVQPEDVVELLKGGLFQMPQAVPADASPAGVWINPATYEIQVATHSNNFGLVRFGELLPIVGMGEVVRIELASLDVDAALFGDEVVALSAPLPPPGFGVIRHCSRCRQPLDPNEAVAVRPLPLGFRYCPTCAA